MSRTVGPTITCLNTSANVAAANSTWFSIEGADQVLVDIVIVGTANAHIDWDYHNNNTVSSNNTYTSNNTYVNDDPIGQMRCWADGIDANESVSVKIRKIYSNQR
jgi:hypothetical protein